MPATFGLGLLFLLIGMESAGIPLPGETALLAAAVLASQGHLSLPLVIATAAAAAIVGDNVGYVIGRQGVRLLLARPGRFERRRARFLADGDAFFARHGGKAVFLGRWVTGVRVVVAWLAGANRMPWPHFALWNALGGVAWASSVALVAYWIGSASSSILGALGLLALAVALAAAFAYALRPRFSGFRLAAMRSRPALGKVDVMLRCLLVDDSAAFLDAAASLLEREGLEVAGVASTSDEAMRQAAKLRPDVVLVDITLGSESGLELARRLVEADRRTTVILVSTHSEADYADLIAQTPAAGFVPKSELSADAIRQLASPHTLE